MANSKFDMSLLKPVQSGWDESKLKPLEEEEEIPYTPPPPRTGWRGILSDIEELPGKALDYAMELPGQASASAGQLYHKPGRALMNLLAGAGELGEGILNTPHEALKYLGKREVIPEWLKKYNELPFTHIPNLGIEEAMGLDKTEEGDQFLRQLPGLIAGGKALKSMPGVKTAIESVKAQAKYRPLKKKVGELEAEHETATGEHKAATEEYNALKNFLEGQLGYEGSNPNILERKAAEAQQKLAQLQEQSAGVPEHLRATEEPIAPEKTPLSLVEPIRANEEPLQQAESLLRTNEQKSADLEKQFGEGHLKKGYAHDVPVAEAVTQAIEGVKNPKTGRREGGRKKEIGAMYDEVENSLKDEHVLIPQSEQLANAEKEIRAQLESSRAHFKNDEDFDNLVKKLAKEDTKQNKKGPHDIVPAADVLKNYRTMRHLSQELRKKAFSPKYAGNKELQGQALEQAAEYERIGNNLEKVLEDNDLGTSLVTLKQANKRWREEITPLYKNSTYQMFLNKGLGPSDIIKALRGNGPGQEIIRDIIKSDPELLRNVVGQRYANNPAKLHEFDELTQEYTQHMPEVQEFRKQHFASKEAESQARMAHERAKHEHQLAREEAASQTRQKKAEVHKENQAKQKEHEEKSKYFKMQKEIKDLDEKSAKLTDHAKKIREKANRKDITLKQKLDFEHELAQNKKQLDKLDKERRRIGKIAKGLGLTAVGVAVGTPIYRKAKSMIGGLK